MTDQENETFPGLDSLEVEPVEEPSALVEALKDSILEAAQRHYRGGRADMEKYAAALATGTVAASVSNNTKLLEQIKAAPEQLAEGYKVSLAASAQSRVNTVVFTAIRIILATLPK